MKRIWFILLCVLLAAISCINEKLTFDSTLEESADDYGKVTIPFEVMGCEVIDPATKTIPLGEDTPLNTLHLAVFGGNGYLKEYVKAHDLERVGDTTYINRDGEAVTTARYRFKATLTLTENKRTIHFIGNGPSTLSFGYADKVIPSLLSDVNGRSYWQMDSIYGIRAKKSQTTYTDRNNTLVRPGDYIDAEACKIVNGRGYIPDSATLSAFRAIPLVRNWAKIVVMSDSTQSYFNPYGYAVINVPSRGAIAPYCANTGFVRNYQDYSYNQLDSMNYTANLNINTKFDTDIPTDEDFKNYTNGVSRADANGGVYIYERPVPNSTTTFPASAVIVYGYYYNPRDLEHKGFYYYKVDLMEGDKYYPVFRNFQYEIVIDKILSQGHHSPAAAAAAAGSANVSADINTQHLADISDGIGRLIIDPWMMHTYTEKVTDGKLQCFYVDSVYAWRVNLDSDAVTVQKLPMPLGETDVIDTVWIDPPITDIEGSIGWRTIHFNTHDRGATAHTQSIRVTAQHGLSTLYRDIQITLLPKQPMVVRFPNRVVAAQKTSEVTMEIVIPDGLAESMFPLDFWIEPERMTLTPDNTKSSQNNLPVKPGDSISENPEYAGKPTFHYTRSLSWEEYRMLATEKDEDGKKFRVLPCYFVTNCDDNATTVWVQNEYFITNSDYFTNEDEHLFRNLSIPAPIKREEGSTIPLHFTIAEAPGGTYPAITLSCYGMELDMNSTEDPVSKVTDGLYQLWPSSATVDLSFVATTNDGDVGVEIAADGYTPKSLTSHYFSEFGFIDGHMMWKDNKWSNVALGHVNNATNKTVLFGYCDDPDAPNTPISVSVKNNKLSFRNPTAAQYPWTPDGPRSSSGNPLYHEIEFTTPGTSSSEPVELTLSSPGYVEEVVVAKRFQGDILTNSADITKNKIFKSGSGFTVENPSFTVVQDPSKPKDVTVTFSFDSITSAYKTGNNPDGMLLGPGGTYTLTVTSNNNNYAIFYIQFNVSNTKWNNVTQHLAPESWSPSVGTVTKYKGGNDQYIWSLPQGTRSAEMTFTAHEDYPINIQSIVFKSYNATMY